ncbi:MAG TPA: hypothetical protein PKY05_04310 [Fibrobacteria bacterium]|nr:hypothetical protein [Fibrobacteria bacterium]
MDSSSLDHIRLHNSFLNTEYVRYSLYLLAALVVAGFLWVKRIG